MKVLAGKLRPFVPSASVRFCDDFISIACVRNGCWTQSSMKHICVNDKGRESVALCIHVERNRSTATYAISIEVDHDVADEPL